MCTAANGPSGVALGARLKALDVPYLVIEKNARAGDNWALRYDCLQFHIPTSFCELPYIGMSHLRACVAAIFGMTG